MFFHPNLDGKLTKYENRENYNGKHEWTDNDDVIYIYKKTKKKNHFFLFFETFILYLPMGLPPYLDFNILRA